MADRAELFPGLGLVVSGGHTSLYEMASPVSFVRIGKTIDDAVGEAYDKVAAMLGLGFPGGPMVDTLAQRGRADRHEFPLGTLGRDSLDFSFSGLKTAVKYAAFGVPRRGERAMVPRALGDATIADLCAGFQAAAVETLVRKVGRALDQGAAARGSPVRAFFVGGGVSANSLLRSRLAELGAARGIRVIMPARGLCLDNAAMIAGLGHALLAERAWRGDALSLGASPSGGV